MAPPGNDALICLSHLRWNFVYQRPQHLMTRCARDRRVFFFEEPVFDSEVPRLDTSSDGTGVVVAVPHLPHGLRPDAAVRELRSLVDGLIVLERIASYVLWYYTPMALRFTQHLKPSAVVYDCMDELSGFAGAPPGLRETERRLLQLSDVVFTGGQSLYEAKRHLHPNVHAFPSSVDVPHFARARRVVHDPTDQALIPAPRLGFYGVIDERFDIELVRAVAAARRDWQFVFIGPVVKIDPANLPMAPNIHYLGARSYAQLPEYLAGWNVALLPFARNDATRFISPTKTPEYLAAGKPVVSTSIRDVIRPYADLNLARIADTPDEMITAIEAALAQPAAAWLPAADAYLATLSWDKTWTGMWRLIADAITGHADYRPSRPGLSDSDVTGLGSTPATA